MTRDLELIQPNWPDWSQPNPDFSLYHLTELIHSGAGIGF